MVPLVCFLTHSPFQNLQRSKRDIYNTDLAFITIFPQYGSAKVAEELIKMAAALELLANETADSLTDMSKMMVMRTVAMLNRTAFDLVLAAQAVLKLGLNVILTVHPTQIRTHSKFDRKN